MGIKDTAYASLFDKKDLPYIYRLAEEVRTTHNQDLVNSFNNTLEKKWNDHHPTLEIGNKNIEMLQVSKADDLIVTVGINQCIDQILGASVLRWQNMASGSGTTAASIGQTALVTQLFVIDMSSSGWREYAGASLRFAGIFGESLATHTVNEAAISRSDGAVILNRNMFSNFPISHTINVTGYVISCVIEFVPVM